MDRPEASVFALGAVQLGLSYGISRESDELPDGQAILRTAEDQGLRLVDTAAQYGCSEAVIGAYLRARPDSALEIASKLPPQGDMGSAEAVVEQVRGSVERIGRPLAAIMLHNADRLPAWRGPLGDGLKQARDLGLARLLGVSVYTPDQFAAALDIPEIGMIQAPMNVLDRRLAETGLIAAAEARGVQVVIRSAFLQGLLLMDPAAIPAPMAFARPAIVAFRDICAEASPHAVALAAVRRLAPSARIVVGCHSPAQLLDNLAALAAQPPASLVDAALALPQGETRLINPALWPELRP